MGSSDPFNQPEGATTLLASLLTVAQPETGTIRVPLLGDIADAVSVGVANADHQTVCTTTHETRYYYGNPYQHPVRKCSVQQHRRLDLQEGNKAAAYAAVAIALTFAGCPACGIAVTAVGVLDAFLPDSRAAQNSCSPAKTGVRHCPR